MLSVIFLVDPWKLSVHFIVLRQNMCDPNIRVFSTTTVSASVSDNGANISGGCNNPDITAVCIRRSASNSGPREMSKAPTVTSMDN